MTDIKLTDIKTTHVAVSICGVKELANDLDSEMLRQKIAFEIQQAIQKEMYEVIGLPWTPGVFHFRPPDTVVDAKPVKFGDDPTTT